MKFAAILKSTLDWKCALINQEGKVFFTDISEWGFTYNENFTPTMRPLNYIGKDISALPNFICVIDPNEEIDSGHFDFLVRRKIQELRNLKTLGMDFISHPSTKK